MFFVRTFVCADLFVFLCFSFPFFLLLHFKKTILCQVKRKEFAILRSVLYYLTNKNIAISFCYVIKHTETGNGTAIKYFCERTIEDIFG